MEESVPSDFKISIGPDYLSVIKAEFVQYWTFLPMHVKELGPI